MHDTLGDGVRGCRGYAKFGDGWRALTVVTRDPVWVPVVSVAVRGDARIFGPSTKPLTKLTVPQVPEAR